MKTSQPEIEARAEQLAQDHEVRRALEQTAARPSPPQALSWGVAMYFVALVALGVGSHFVAALPSGQAHAYGALRGVMGALVDGLLVLVVARLVDRLLVARVDDGVARYNLRRIVYLLGGVGCALVLLTQLFANWYTGIVSVGVVSLVVSLSLQPAITSFIGWVYILVRSPYRVGDRIQIGDAQGDVIDVGYLDTTLWEFGGPYLSTDHPSGRLIKFPNSLVLQNRVYNYSWPLFPYIWNEIKFSVAYDSDLEFVEQVMREVVAADIGEEMMARVSVFRELLAQTPVDELTVQERPSVVFRVASNTFLDAIVRYVVDPRQQGRVKTRLIKKLLARLNEHPDRVRFPRGDQR